MKKTILIVLSMFLILSFCSCNSSQQEDQTTPQAAEEPTQTPKQAEPEPTATPEPTEQTTPQPTPAEAPGLKPVSVKLELIESYPNLSFAKPLYFTTTGADNCYVVQQTGQILIFEDDPDVQDSQVFLDLGDIVNTRGNEEGLLGLAFHPDYESNGYFYVNYTSATGTVVARYTRSEDDPSAADPGSAHIMLTFDQPYANHNAGHMDFGPDGYLYIATGDGGSGGDPEKYAQNLSSLLGNILRIDINNPGENGLYGIPEDNPFAGNTEGYAEEIYAYGLRNPWRFSFDEEGQLWAADVGQNKIEEIDIIVKGGNYGWNVMEGTLIFEDNPDIDKAVLIPPVFEYNHDEGYSITGGYVYSGEAIPDLQSRYIYGDYGTGRIWALWFDAEGIVQNQLLIDTDYNISSFGINADGELRVMDLSGGVYSFKVME